MERVIVIPALGDNFAYLFRYEENKTVAVDPADGSLVLNEIKKHGLELTGILATHHHFDHTAGIKELQHKTNCQVIKSGQVGGGLYDCDGTITNCTISGNMGHKGGGLYRCDGSIINCIIADNRAGYGGPFDNPKGGGLYECTGPITNCTIANNIAENYGGGLYNCGSITNCIIWGNSASIAGDQLHNSLIPIYSCIQDWIGGGVGNIISDPNFVTGPLGGYYLSQTGAGQGVDSACVDAGSDTAENLGMDIYTTRTDKVWDVGIVDMGYHYSGNIADFDNDGNVDLEEFGILFSQWQDVPGTPSADIAPAGGDNFVDMQDLKLLAENLLWP